MLSRCGRQLVHVSYVMQHMWRLPGKRSGFGRPRKKVSCSWRPSTSLRRSRNVIPVDAVGTIVSM